MGKIQQRITSCFWFDGQAEQAAEFYTSIFPNSKIGEISRFGKEGFEFHGMLEGTAMTVNFELDGIKFMGLNGGPHFQFNESISLVIHCANQSEIDHYWNSLTAAGKESQCGWLKDQFGISWQVVPTRLGEMLSDPEPKKRGSVMQALMPMKKIDLPTLEKAFESET